MYSLYAVHIVLNQTLTVCFSFASLADLFYDMSWEPSSVAVLWLKPGKRNFERDDLFLLTLQTKVSDHEVMSELKVYSTNQKLTLSLARWA